MRRGILIICFICMVFCFMGERKVTCEVYEHVTVTTFEDLKNYLQSKYEYSIRLGKDITATEQINVRGRKWLDGNGFSVRRGKDWIGESLLYLYDGAKLTLSGPLELSGGNNARKGNGSLIYVDKEATLSVERSGVRLCNNYAHTVGGAIYNAGTVEMEYATIEYCNSVASGGAIYIEAGARCFLYDCLIANNHAGISGGGIYQANNGILKIEQTTKIVDNTCEENGSAIYSDGCTDLTSYGMIVGDIYLATNGFLNISNGHIYSGLILAADPQVGKMLVRGGAHYIDRVNWSGKQLYATEYPICAVGNDLYIGAYYSICYYLDGAKTSLYHSQSKLFGTDVTLLATGPNKTGYTFAGWYTAPVDGSDVTGGLYGGNADVAYYAQYIANTYAVTLQSDGGTYDEIKLQYEAPYGQLPIPEREGYTFAGWYLDNNYQFPVNNATIVNTAANHTLYAKWAVNTYTVQFEANGGTTSLQNKQVVYLEEYGALPTATRVGYEFTGWFTKPGDGVSVTETTQLTTASHHTLYAGWRPLSYMVTWDSCGGTVAYMASMVTFDSTYGNIPNVSRAGYQFLGWYTEKTGGTQCGQTTVVKVANNHTLYARWRKINQEAVTIVRIYMTGIPQYYREGDSIQTKNAKIVIEYSDSTRKVLSSGWKICSYSKNAGTRDVVFVYENKSCTYQCIWLSNSEIVKLRPTKTSYTGYAGSKKIVQYSSTYKDISVTFESSNKKIVSVNKNGVLTMKKPGTAYVTVYISLGTIQRKVKVKVVVRKLVLKSSYHYMKKWNYIQFSGKIQGLNKKTVFISSNKRIATINKRTGVLKGRGTGMVTITIKVGNLYKKYRVNVNKVYRYISIQ